MFCGHLQQLSLVWILHGSLELPHWESSFVGLFWAALQLDWVAALRKNRCLSILMTDNLTCFIGASFKEINILIAEPLAVDSFLVLRNVIFFVLAWIRPQSTSWSLSWIFICQYFHISSYYHTAAYVISLFCVYACRQFYECSCNKRKVWEHIKRQWNPHCESRPFFSFFSFNI